MRVIEKIISVRSRPETVVKLIPLGDIHVGHRDLDLDRLTKTIDFIKNDPQCYVIGMGDYAEAIDFKDMRADPNTMDRDLLTPDEQYAKVEELLEPIKDKIICLLDGNHDYMFWMRHSHNFVDVMAHNLEVPYAGFSAYIRIKTERAKANRTQFNAYAHHGWSSSRSEGGAVNSIHDLHNKFPGLHLYLMGHTHRLGEALPRTTLYIDDGGNIREWIEKYVFTGAFFKGYEQGKGSSYVETHGYNPLMIGAPIIEIKQNRIDCRAADKHKPPFSMRISTDDWF
jgi:hypothetical protein